MNPKKNVVISIKATVSNMEMNVPEDQVEQELKEIKDTMTLFFQHTMFGGELKEGDQLSVEITTED